MMPSRRRALFVHPSFQPPGGGNAVAGWMLATLLQDHEVDVLTRVPLEPRAVDEHYGTALAGSGYRSLPPGLSSLFPKGDLIRLDLLRDCALSAEVRRLIRRERYDLLVTAANEGILPCPGIQYVHYPRFGEPRPAEDLRSFHLKPLVKAYRFVGKQLFRASLGALDVQVALANSAWTAERYFETHGTRAQVLHPPVLCDFPETPWEERTNDFVCVGRLWKGKRIDVAIRIVEGVRSRGHDVGLSVVGALGAAADFAAIQSLAATRPWVRLELDLPREKMTDVIAKHRFGIHAMIDEHFGMAVAEMLAAGIVPFVHQSGGPYEILRDEPRCSWSSAEDAVNTIDAMLRAPSEISELWQRLHRRGHEFSVQRFCTRFAEIVEEFHRGGGANAEPDAPRYSGIRDLRDLGSTAQVAEGRAVAE